MSGGMTGEDDKNPAAETGGREDIISLMELLFFAYRDFISDPDAILAEIGFGRAHHRIIHFVGRQPGLRVSELLDILRITKQSLGRVLRELIDKGYIYQQEGERDRRQRLLYLTAKGEDLLARLSAPQIARIGRALDEAGPDSEKVFATVLERIVDEGERARVRRVTGREKAGG
jgi:DNA-binding MarR family transcriptional regulator